MISTQERADALAFVAACLAHAPKQAAYSRFKIIAPRELMRPIREMFSSVDVFDRELV